MSSAFRSFLPELLATRQARAARRGRAFLVLDAALSASLFGNAAGARAFGIPAAGGSMPTVLVRQIRSSARVLAERGAAALLLRVPAGRSAQPIAASATRIGTGEASVYVLAAENGGAGVECEPDMFLAALGLAANEAAIFGIDGRLAAGTDPGVDLADPLAGFVADDAEARTLDIGGRSVRLLRIDDELVLVEETTPEGAQNKDAEGPRPSNGTQPETTGDPAASRVEIREEASTGTTRPRRLRSLWGPLPASDPAGDPVPDADETGVADDPAGGTFDRAPSATGTSVAATPVADAPPDADASSTPSSFVPRFELAPVRFVWQIGADGRFRSISGELAETVGPRSAAVIGRTFVEAAAELGFDEGGAIRRLLERRDTWSGRTVLWPVENSDRRVPIDLAALPTYSRDRLFDGFRGFGIIRVVDHEADPRDHGRNFAATEREAPVGEPVVDAALADVAPSKPVFRAFEADPPEVSFGRREAPPAAPADSEAGKVVRLTSADRRRSSEATLSEAEKAAFREIGAKLGQKQTEAETPGALRFEGAAPGPAARKPAPIEAGKPRVDPPDAAPATRIATAAEPDEHRTEPRLLPAPSDGGIDVSPDIRTVLARLPLPAIVQGMDALVFANRAFLDFAGYDDMDSLNRAGGLDALFAEPALDQAEAHALTVRRANGEAVEASVRMQRIAFAGRSSLLMTFEQEAPVVAAPADDEGDDGDDLRDELAEMRTVLDIATDGVVLVDPQGIVRSANGSAQALFGMGEQEFRDQPVAALFARESQKAVADYFETLRNKGLAGILNDGREVIGRVAQGGFVPLFITAGRVSEERGWCVVIRDMSHWKRIEEELVNAKRAAEAASLHKSRFLANISHELRTPLNAIIGFADVMASECFGPIGSERYIEYLGDIKRSGHHVLDLVNDLLDISKIEAGRMELTFESVSLNEILVEVVSTMQPQANRERVIVRSNLPASVPPVVADRRTIRQIALNLLSNSVRFTPAGGQVIASTTYTSDGSVLLRVRDSGVGMTADEIELALTPFQQVQKPGEIRNEGTGLGLPLTKAMTEANRASFAIRSTPGEGTLVEIAFPAQRVLLD